jgi:hypothetical protein
LPISASSCISTVTETSFLPTLPRLERTPPAFGGRGRRGAGPAGFELRWITRLRDTRALTISAEGRAGLAKTFGIALPA